MKCNYCNEKADHTYNNEILCMQHLIKRLNENGEVKKMETKERIEKMNSWKKQIESERQKIAQARAAIKTSRSAIKNCNAAMKELKMKSRADKQLERKAKITKQIEKLQEKLK